MVSPRARMAGHMHTGEGHMPAASAGDAAPPLEEVGSMYSIQLEEAKCPSSSSMQATEPKANGGGLRGIFRRLSPATGAASVPRGRLTGGLSSLKEVTTPGEGAGWMSMALIIESANMPVLYWFMTKLQPAAVFRPASLLTAATTMTLVLCLALFRRELRLDCFRTIDRRAWLALVLSGLLGPALSSFLTVTGLRMTSVPTAVLVSRFDTVFLLVLHPPSSARAICRPLPVLCAAALIASVFIVAFFQPPDGTRFPVGVAMLFGGSLFSALDQAVLRQKLADAALGPVTITRLLVACLALHLITVIDQHHIKQAYHSYLWIMCLWYVPVFALMPRAIWYRGVRLAHAGTRAWAPLMAMVLTFGWSTMAFGEPAGREMLGLALVMLALAASVLARRSSGQYEAEDERRETWSSTLPSTGGSASAPASESGGTSAPSTSGVTWHWLRWISSIDSRDVDPVSDRQLPDRFV